ncbi:MAG: hypothetical protein RBS29_09455 [Bacteroidales bacterium]|jgi:hypothetical protein|nr:hypothetical protein [Bacteroidales bacterium]
MSNSLFINQALKILLLTIMLLISISSCYESSADYENSSSYSNYDDYDKADATLLSGKWVGKYECGQGETGLTLTIEGQSDGNVDAIFHFYAIPENPGVPSGKYSMEGVFTTKRLLLLNATEDAWIERPIGWGTVNIEGYVSDDFTTYGGIVIGCKEFSLVKEN